LLRDTFEDLVRGGPKIIPELRQLALELGRGDAQDHLPRRPVHRCRPGARGSPASRRSISFFRWHFFRLSISFTTLPSRLSSISFQAFRARSPSRSDAV
jgi:hypothetical protein